MPASKRKADKDPGQTALQEKKQKLTRGILKVKDHIDLSTLRPEQLDEAIENYEKAEIETIEAFAQRPIWLDDYAKVQDDWMALFAHDRTRLTQLRLERKDEQPNTQRSRAVCKFFLEMSYDSRLGDNDLLRDAIMYRLACWFNAHVFGGKFTDVKAVDFEINLISKDMKGEDLYRMAVRGAVRHVRRIESLEFAQADEIELGLQERL